VTDDVDAVTVTACTVATLRQLPAVRVLAKSFTDHNPGARFHALLVDSDTDLGYLHPTALGITDDELARLRTAYGPDELCAVLRPRLLHWLVTSPRTSGPVLHLDPCVLVVAPIVAPILDGLVEHSLVLLPRVLRPLPDDGLRPDAADLRTAGMFDPALVAVNRGAEEFLKAWAEHARHEPSDAFLDGAAVLLEHHVLRDMVFQQYGWNTMSYATPASACRYGTRPNAHYTPTNAAP
jgi:hypothetical protein